VSPFRNKLLPDLLIDKDKSFYAFYTLFFGGSYIYLLYLYLYLYLINQFF